MNAAALGACAANGRSRANGRTRTARAIAAPSVRDPLWWPLSANWWTLWSLVAALRRTLPQPCPQLQCVCRRPREQSAKRKACRPQQQQSLLAKPTACFKVKHTHETTARAPRPMVGMALTPLAKFAGTGATWLANRRPNPFLPPTRRAPTPCQRPSVADLSAALAAARGNAPPRR